MRSFPLRTTGFVTTKDGNTLIQHVSSIITQCTRTKKNNLCHEKDDEKPKSAATQRNHNSNGVHGCGMYVQQQRSSNKRKQSWRRRRATGIHSPRRDSFGIFFFHFFRRVC